MSHACSAFAAPSELAGASPACRRYTANSSTPDAAKVTGGTHRRFRGQPGGRAGSRSSSHLAGTARRAAEMIVPVMGWDASLGVARECPECAGSRTWHSVVAVTIAAGVAHGEERARRPWPRTRPPRCSPAPQAKLNGMITIASAESTVLDARMAGLVAE